jgi:hypothetical protein
MTAARKELPKFQATTESPRNSRLAVRARPGANVNPPIPDTCVDKPKRTQSEVAKMRGVNIRTVKRWAKLGANIQDDAAIDSYLDARRPG